MEEQNEGDTENIFIMLHTIICKLSTLNRLNQLNRLNRRWCRRRADVWAQA